MKKYSKFILASVLLFTFSENSLAANISRIGGVDRYETSAKISQASLKSADTVIIVSGDSFADAISVSALSMQKDWPILLVNTDLPKSTLDEIKRLGAKKAVIIGGKSSISQDVEEKISKLAEVERIEGGDRYETSLKIFDYKKKLNPKSTRLGFASGKNFADALSAAPYIYKDGSIVLYDEEINNDILKNRRPDIIFGGEKSVPGFKGVDRIYGADRYETSLNIAKRLGNKNLVIASGRDFPDALSSGIVAKNKNASIILSTPNFDEVLNADKNKVLELLKDANYLKTIETITIIGGKESVPSSLDSFLEKIIDTTKNTSVSSPRASSGGGYNVSNNTNKVEPFSIPEEYKDFYVSLFNKYSNFEKKYTNLTDEANEKFDKNNPPIKDGKISEQDMLMLKEFKLSDKNATDDILKPLYYAKNLESFNVELNDASLKRETKDFSFLKELKNLKKFYYVNLDYKNSEKENLPDFDFKENKNLEDVRITFSNIKNLDFLKGLNLKNLSMEDNEIKDISAIKDMSNLERLDLDNNKVEDLGDNFKNLKNLITLYLRDNPISNVESLSETKSLEALHLKNTGVKNISPLLSLDNLHRLYLNDNNLGQGYFDDIKKMSSLNTVFVTDIDIEQFNWLKTFSTRDAVDAKFEEDKVRIINFDKLEIPIEIDREKIENNSVTIDNPLKNYDELSIIDDADPDMSEVVSKSENIGFVDDSIEIQNISSDNFEETYEIYIVDYSSGNGYGSYEQPAEISGKVVLKISIK